MQKSPRIMQHQHGPYHQHSNINQLYFNSTSPRQKPRENTYTKSPNNSVKVGDKYTYSTEDMIGDGYTSRVYKGHEIEKPTKTYAIKVIDKKRLDKDQIKLIKN